MATDRRNTHRWAGWATIILVVALIGYPLSVGPLGLLSKATGDSAEFNRIMDPYYVPLRKLPPWARGALARWSHFWRGDRPNQYAAAESSDARVDDFRAIDGNVEPTRKALSGNTVGPHVVAFRSRLRPFFRGAKDDKLASF